ncbi:MAG: peptide-methionine (R)-S-oxide reductase MsrB [Bacteroidetes bacterium]|nr:peptide-methionine (R)-S-oxide reductase MsrB [Bacteroidota bacterium]
MKNMIRIANLVFLGLMMQSCTYSQSSSNKDVNTMDNTVKKENNPVYSHHDTSKVEISDQEWQKLLPKDVYNVARLKGTERPWSSKFEKSKEIGTYYCAVCGNPLFKSDTKFDSGCGWPSFYEPISKTGIIYAEDNSYGMERTEVMCARCKSHLGHVFNDGPPPTGLRFCINGVVLDFEKAKETEKKYQEQHKQS